MDSSVTAGKLDFSSCDRQQVQFPGAIFPHGVLLVLDVAGQKVLQASANTHTYFDLDASELINKDIGHLFGQGPITVLQKRFAELPESTNPVYLGRINARSAQKFDAFAHRIEGVIVLELELVLNDTPVPIADLYVEVRQCTTRLHAAKTVRETLEVVVDQLRRMTGYDSVLGFKFFEDGSGCVLAESRRPEFASYLDKHFPATDVPEPARRQLRVTPFQYVSDAAYEPVPLVPEMHPLTGRPLDLTFALLRCTSRMCDRYYLNMGVHGKLVLSLLKDGELWGIISCLSATPHHLPHDVRMACESLANMVSLLLSAKQQAEHYAQALETKRRVGQMIDCMTKEPVFQLCLVQQHEPNLSECLDAQGAAVIIDNAMTMLGNTPTEAEVKDLLSWLDSQTEIIATRHLPERYPPARQFQKSASGLLAARLSAGKGYLLWFRPEVVEEISWAGDPNKPMEVDEENGEIRLTPRRSFELWKETVYGTARAWQEYEIEAADELRRAVNTLHQMEELNRTKSQLEKSNAELESFAYIASHDLKEPLRGIRNFSHILEESVGQSLNLEDQRRLGTITRLTQRMDNLIETLLQYSRTERLELSREEADLNEIVNNITQPLEGDPTRQARIIIPKPLPRVVCDPVRISEVFSNLITNSIKYNDKPEKCVEIGFTEGKPVTFYVRDNGIGISQNHYEDIFRIFKRLHKRDEYGGGTGAGLTITKKVIERHGGNIWLESKPEEGTTFYFTLGPIGEN